MTQFRTSVMPSERSVGVLCLAVAAGYVVIGATHFLLPAGQLQGSSLFTSLASDGTCVFRLHYWAFAITSLLAMAVVVAIRPDDSLWLRITRVWALLAFGLTAVDFLYVQQRALTIAEHWSSLDASSRAALLALGSGRLDATWFIGFAALAPWPVALARCSPSWPATTRIAAYLVAIDAACVCLGALTHDSAFINAAAAGAIVVTPAFFGVVGAGSLRRA